MSLSKEALDAIAAFRKNVSENPSDYVDEESTLKSKLISLVERNSSESEGRYLEKIYDSYLNYNFSHFNFSSPNRDKKFDKEEYLLAEFLYAPTFKLQKTLVSEWRDHLKDLTEEEFKKNEDLKNSYEKVNLPINSDFIQSMSNGVQILDTITKNCFVKQLGTRNFKIILTQGLNRQIRRMCEALGYRVRSLKRVRIMNIKLDVPTGKYRELTKEELLELNRLLENSAKTNE